jgi:hypothetical protein
VGAPSDSKIEIQQKQQQRTATRHDARFFLSLSLSSKFTAFSLFNNRNVSPALHLDRLLLIFPQDFFILQDHHEVHIDCRIVASEALDAESTSG